MKIMSTSLIHSGPEQTIWEVMELMYARGVRTIPITHEHDRLSRNNKFDGCDQNVISAKKLIFHTTRRITNSLR